jgi:hypothetical protein
MVAILASGPASTKVFTSVLDPEGGRILDYLEVRNNRASVVAWKKVDALAMNQHRNISSSNKQLLISSVICIL